MRSTTAVRADALSPETNRTRRPPGTAGSAPRESSEKRVEGLHKARTGDGVGNDLRRQATFKVARRKGRKVDRIRRVDHDAAAPFDNLNRVGHGIEWDRQNDEVGPQGLRRRHRLYQSPKSADQVGQAFRAFGVGKGDFDPFGDEAPGARCRSLPIQGSRMSFC
jgi:hypothetical protein